MRYFSHSDESVRLMLSSIGKNELSDLFSSIPENLRLERALDLPGPQDELSLKNELGIFLAKAHVHNFIGAGATAHFVPEWISQQLLRAEWYTSYTPYQPEVSQGTLQAIFEFQSMVASLFALDVANASMYDGATALVEAVLMAVRTTGKKAVLVAETLHPEYRATLATYLSPIGIDIFVIPFDENGVSTLQDFSAIVPKLAAVVVQSPNFFGRIEALKSFAHYAHAHEALFIACTTDPSSCALWESFAHAGADIAVGEGLGFVGALHLGGPGLGLLAAKQSLLRQIPGRLVGLTHDKNNHECFTLTLSTREQHIRREKATSNICTNHNLMALAFSMTLASYGKVGFKELAQKNVKKTLYFRQVLSKQGIPVAFLGPHYNESVIKLGSDEELDKRIAIARKHNIVAGLKLSSFYPHLAGHLLVATTELHRDEDIKKLGSILSGTIHD